MGYIVNGSITADKSSSEVYCGLLGDLINIDKNLREFWEIESVNEFESILNNEKLECKMLFTKTRSRDME